MADRTVHCTIVPASGSRIEYVRYDRSGKWYREDNGRRTHIRVIDAIEAASQIRPAVIWHEGLPGGTYFDSQVRRRRNAARGEQR